ncbi:MAG TPA: hypothetical protein VN180_00520 [Acidimicrobiia bacterium]|nr:hypothetical protein [Acidimicrobiia bacterium]
MTYFDDDELAEEADLSSDLVDLLQSAERFQSRPRLPPIDDPEAGETLDWEGREEPADDEG